eukprot:g4063.t1
MARDLEESDDGNSTAGYDDDDDDDGDDDDGVAESKGHDFSLLTDDLANMVRAQYLSFEEALCMMPAPNASSPRASEAQARAAPPSTPPTDSRIGQKRVAVFSPGRVARNLNLYDADAETDTETGNVATADENEKPEPNLATASPMRIVKDHVRKRREVSPYNAWSYKSMSPAMILASLEEARAIVAEGSSGGVESAKVDDVYSFLADHICEMAADLFNNRTSWTELCDIWATQGSEGTNVQAFGQCQELLLGSALQCLREGRIVSSACRALQMALDTPSGRFSVSSETNNVRAVNISFFLAEGGYDTLSMLVEESNIDGSKAKNDHIYRLMDLFFTTHRQRASQLGAISLTAFDEIWARTLSSFVQRLEGLDIGVFADCCQQSSFSAMLDRIASFAPQHDRQLTVLGERTLLALKEKSLACFRSSKLRLRCFGIERLAATASVMVDRHVERAKGSLEDIPIASITEDAASSPSAKVVAEKDLLQTARTAAKVEVSEWVLRDRVLSHLLGEEQDDRVVACSLPLLTQLEWSSSGNAHNIGFIEQLCNKVGSQQVLEVMVSLIVHDNFCQEAAVRVLEFLQGALVGGESPIPRSVAIRFTKALLSESRKSAYAANKDAPRSRVQAKGIEANMAVLETLWTALFSPLCDVEERDAGNESSLMHSFLDAFDAAYSSKNGSAFSSHEVYFSRCTQIISAAVLQDTTKAETHQESIASWTSAAPDGEALDIVLEILFGICRTLPARVAKSVKSGQPRVSKDDAMLSISFQGRNLLFLLTSELEGCIERVQDQGLALRLDLMAYCLRHSSMMMTTSNVKHLWNVFANRPRAQMEAFFAFLRTLSYPPNSFSGIEGSAGFTNYVALFILEHMIDHMDPEKLGHRGWFCFQALFLSVNAFYGRLCHDGDQRVLFERRFQQSALPAQFRGPNIIGSWIKILMRGGVYVRGQVKAYNSARRTHKIEYENANVCGGSGFEPLEGGKLSDWSLLSASDADVAAPANLRTVSHTNLIGLEGIWKIALRGGDEEGYDVAK